MMLSSDDLYPLLVVSICAVGCQVDNGTEQEEATIHPPLHPCGAKILGELSKSCSYGKR